jgi:hypothetical protein
MADISPSLLSFFKEIKNKANRSLHYIDYVFKQNKGGMRSNA